MPVKINTINIHGLRGIKNEISLPLNGKSILLYGENGTGKSSVSDSIEWFYTDSVSHLSGGEIDLKEALRNTLQEEAISSYVAVGLTNKQFDNTKNLYFKKGSLACETTNNSIEAKDYLNKSKSENIILRHESLTEFVEKTKTDKLKELSEIIGYTEVTKTKEALKKTLSTLSSELKNQNFETQTNTQKQTLLDKIGASISKEEDLIKCINSKLNSTELEFRISTLSEVPELLEKLKKKPIDNNIVLELKFLESCKTTLSTLKQDSNSIHQHYVSYYTEFNKIADDIQGIMQTFLKELLKVGKDVITKKCHKLDECPLCLQSKSHEQLVKEIQDRIREIEVAAQKKASFDTAKETVVKVSAERVNRLNALLYEKYFANDINKSIKATIESLKLKLAYFQAQANIKVTSGEKPSILDQVKLSENDFEVIDEIESRIAKLKEPKKEPDYTVLYSDISASIDAFKNIKKIHSVQKILEKQKTSLETLYNEFVKKQKQGLESFINTLSTSINKFYQYMNPNEMFQEIKVTTIGDEDSLNGITVEYKYNGKWISPPQKYFSESHLNCFGIAFFLASVVAFNKENDFIILDDVISSFDSNHRKRFADMLFDLFPNKQIILLTHDYVWFQYISKLAKKHQWIIQETKWSDVGGTALNDRPADLKELIVTNIASGSIELLGNPIRKYLESILKEYCANLEVKVSFRHNDENEKRMVDELLCSLRSKLNKQNNFKDCIEAINRVADSTILANLLSHDNNFYAASGDIKAFWKDVEVFESFFYCQHDNCKKPYVSMKNYDPVEKKIRCSCGKTSYDWKN